MKSWSPYAVGLGIGALSCFAFFTADKHLAITLQYEHIAAMIQAVLSPDALRTNGYFAARAAQGLEPKPGWYMMLIIGVFAGAVLSSWLSGDRPSGRAWRSASRRRSRAAP